MEIIEIQDCIGKDYVFIDVRSPKEFIEDRVINAVNVPIFSNEERAIIGTIYTKESKEKAMDVGVDYFSKNLPEIMAKIKPFTGKKMVIYCWRGGMRSKSFTSMLDSLGYDVKQLVGGYKTYRKYVRETLESFEIKPKYIVLHGLTGSGKTEFVNAFKNSLDLEGLAQHRGSFFGDINLKPHTQKMFESLLLDDLLKLQNEKYVVVEGESKKIGKVQIPNFVMKHMKDGTHVQVIVPMKDRVKRIIEDYDIISDDNIELLKEKIGLLSQRLGKKKVLELIKLLEEKNYRELVETVLKEYYDPLYEHYIGQFKISSTFDKNYVEGIKSLMQ